MRLTSRIAIVGCSLGLLAPLVAAPTPAPAPTQQQRRKAYEAAHPGVVWPLGVASEPRQLAYAKPAFPDALKNKRRSLSPIMVIAVITASGQVADPSILRSDHPDLDPYVLSAVAQWRYEPPLVERKPAAIFLIVTVTLEPAL